MKNASLMDVMEFNFRIIGKRKKENKKELKCIRCGLDLPSGRSRKFCSDKCRTRYYSLLRYNKLKDNKEYKIKRRKYHKKWRNEHHERFNELMRKSSKEYQKRFKQEHPIEYKERMKKKEEKRKLKEVKK